MVFHGFPVDFGHGRFNVVHVESVCTSADVSGMNELQGTGSTYPPKRPAPRRSTTWTARTIRFSCPWRLERIFDATLQVAVWLHDVWPLATRAEWRSVMIWCGCSRRLHDRTWRSCCTPFFRLYCSSRRPRRPSGRRCADCRAANRRRCCYCRRRARWLWHATLMTLVATDSATAAPLLHGNEAWIWHPSRKRIRTWQRENPNLINYERALKFPQVSRVIGSHNWKGGR